MSDMQPSRTFGPHRPAWQEQLPKGLRTAAEWLFGSLVLAGIVSAVRTGNLAAIPVTIGVSVLVWMFLTGFREDRRLESPITWWAAVVVLSAVGFLVAAAMIFDPPK